MKPFKTLVAMVLVLIVTSSADATTVRTAPFPGYFLLSGGAHCAVVNTGSVSGTATVVLYDHVGNALATDTFTLSANRTGIGREAFPGPQNPTFCECTVPSTATWRCSFIYVEGSASAPTVIDAR